MCKMQQSQISLSYLYQTKSLSLKGRDKQELSAITQVFISLNVSCLYYLIYCLFPIIMKSQCSMAAYTQKDVNKLILSLAEQPHTEQDFFKLLALKQQFQKQGFVSKAEDLLKIINIKALKRQEQEISNLCNCCFEVMGSSKYWCKICGHYTCKKCLVRERQIKDQSKTYFCDKCDSSYLRAIDGIQLINKVQILQRSFKRLINEQENLEKLVNLERGKHISDKTGISSYASKGVKSAKLIEQNKILKVRCAQLNKKVEFGKQINRELKRKLHGLRKQQKESFGTMSNHQDYNQLVENRRDSLHSQDLNRSSLLTSVADKSEEPQSFNEKCKCDIY